MRGRLPLVPLPAVAAAFAVAATAGFGRDALGQEPLGPAPAGPEIVVAGDAIVRPLGGARGDAGRGAALMADRTRSLCLLCHTGPFPEPHAHGSIGPDLTGVGGRLSEGQIRLRVADMRRLDPASPMPTYLTAGDGERVGAAWRGRPILTAAEIEDLVALLAAEKE